MISNNFSFIWFYFQSQKKIIQLLKNRTAEMTHSINSDSKSFKNEKQRKQFGNLEILAKYLQQQLTTQQLVQNNHQHQIKALQSRKNDLLDLIKNSLSRGNQEQPNTMVSSQIMNRSSVNISKLEKQKQNLKDKSQEIDNRKPLKNRSFVESKISPQKSINYMAKIHEYKHGDLINEIESLFKQLNSMVNKGQSTQTDKSMLKSQILKNPMQQFNLQKGHEISETEFSTKYLSQLGQIQKLPSSNPSQSQDQVLAGLLHNLKKQQERLVLGLFKHKNLLTKKSIKAKLQEKTIQNLRDIYIKNKKEQIVKENRFVKTNKDIVKFGYTQGMLQVIKQKKTSHKLII